MAKVFTGKVAIPGDQFNEYIEMMQKAEAVRQPFKDALNALNREFFDALATQFSERTDRKHSMLIEMFIEFLARQTDVWKLEEVTIGMANSHFQAWHRRKVIDSTNETDRRIAIHKFFLFIALNKGIINDKVLNGSVSSSRTRTRSVDAPKSPIIVKRETLILRAKFAHSKRIYRDIEIPLNSTLSDLAEAIVASVGFEMDHAFGFFATDNPRRYYDATERYELFADDDGADRSRSKSVKRTRLDGVFTREGQKMIFLFDYGDNWLFELEVRGFNSKAAGAPYPRILTSRGDAFIQYPDDEDDEP
ncbi:MAG: plasmid pRiA4b ORF-3 family protein [Magnetococcus sp. YQC-9]